MTRVTRAQAIDRALPVETVVSGEEKPRLGEWGMVPKRRQDLGKTGAHAGLVELPSRIEVATPADADGEKLAGLSTLVDGLTRDAQALGYLHGRKRAPVLREQFVATLDPAQPGFGKRIVRRENADDARMRERHENAAGPRRRGDRLLQLVGLEPIGNLLDRGARPLEERRLERRFPLSAHPVLALGHLT